MFLKSPPMDEKVQKEQNKLQMKRMKLQSAQLDTAMIRAAKTRGDELRRLQA